MVDAAVTVPSRWIAGAWLALGVCLLCLLTAGGSMTTTDAVVSYQVTRHLVEHGSVETDADWLDAYTGRDGRHYSPFGIAQSLWNVPFYVAGRTIASRVRVGTVDTIPKAVVTLGTVPAVALLAWVAFEILLRLGAAPVQALTTALVLVVATPLWPYSSFGFNQPLTALFLWLAVAGAVADPDRHGRARLIAGAAAGLALLTRHEMFLAAAIVGVFIAFEPGRHRTSSVRQYIGGLVPFITAWAVFNWWRFGNPLETGYLRDTVPGLGSSILTGGLGLLFSPYASLLIYCPVAVLSVAGMRALHRRHARAAWLLVGITAVYFLAYASLGNWMGGRSYGPRYLVPLLPALVLPMAFWTRAGVLRLVATAVTVLSIAVQVPGVLVDYSKVRMERAAAGETFAQDPRWRGMPLMLNARALAESGPRAIRDLVTGRPLPHVDETTLSNSPGLSLDLWWLHLVYLRVIGRTSAIVIAAMLAFGAAASLWRAVAMGRRLAVADRAA